MARQELRDRSNRLLGWYEQRGNRIEGFDAKNRRIGTYDTTRNETRDARNSFVGKGNLLATLIPPR